MSCEDCLNIIIIKSERGSILHGGQRGILGPLS